MLAPDTPDLVLRELRDKFGTMGLVTVAAFGASGVITAPVFLLLRRLGLPEFIGGWLQRFGLDNGPAATLSTFLVFCIVLSVFSEIVERQIIPWLLKIGGEDYVTMMKSPHFENLTPADAIFLAPIIKAAQPSIYLVKVKLNEGNSGWIYYYNTVLKYIAMTISFSLVYLAFTWLMNK